MQLFEAFLPIIACALFLAGLGGLIILLLQILRLARLGAREKRYRLIGWQSDLRRGLIIVGALAAISLGNMFFWMNRQLRLYLPVHQESTLGMISVLPPLHENDLQRVVYSTTAEDGRQMFEMFPLRTQIFRVAGERIRWADYMGKLGLTDFFKVTRLEFIPAEMASNPLETPQVVSVRQGSTSLFSSLQRYDDWLPFVTVDTLFSLPMEPQPEFSAHVFVDTSYIILR